MGLFHKKREKAKPCCGGRPAPEGGTSGVQVLGGGCAKCRALEEAVQAALMELEMDTSIEHVTDFAQIAACGVMTTPALVVDGKVVSCGRVLKKDEAKTLLQRARGQDSGAGAQKIAEGNSLP